MYLIYSKTTRNFSAEVRIEYFKLNSFEREDVLEAYLAVVEKLRVRIEEIEKQFTILTLAKDAIQIHFGDL